MPDRRILGPLLAAEVFAVAGDSARALDWVDRAARWGDEREQWLRRDPDLAGIRNHPRFQQILEAVAYRRKTEVVCPWRESLIWGSGIEVNGRIEEA